MPQPNPSGHRWALPQLQPPALWQLEAAHHGGRDPADLVKRWYDACVEAEQEDTDKLIAVAAGDEEELRKLLDLYNAACQAFYRGLSEAGLLDLTRKAARIIDPDASSAELRDAHLEARNGARVRDHTEATEPRETALETQWMLTSASVDTADDPRRRIMQRRRETIRDAEAQVPKSWRRRLDPAGRGLTWSELRWHPAARDRLAGRTARTPARPRPTGAMRQSRPRARRTAASSSTSSADPGGDDPPGDPPPRWVTLWRHPDIRGGGHS